MKPSAFVTLLLACLLIVASVMAKPDLQPPVYLPILVRPYLETEALMALYNSTDGPNWTRNDGWGTAADKCTWFGVTCYSNGRVWILSLYRNNLNGYIAPELGDLSELQQLHLFENNDLSGPIPPELGKLGRLRTLDLYSNNLSGSIPAELGALRRLESLHMFSNNLTGPIPPEVGNMGSLEGLFLNSNNLTGPIPAALANLGNLQGLGLANNPNLPCWETQAALDWALGLSNYEGPTVVCP